ncbi:MAG: hypothetical protein JKZ03_04530 [Flavobacteriaceae bacterium]|nr:hypothetical protein [Flavobacteriaceae bacterium]
MEVKNVYNKIIILSIVLLFSVNKVYCQKTKYLLFDSKKDSIVKIGNIINYKIDNNLFDINRYNQIDTINSKEFKEIKFSSVEKLWTEGKDLFIQVSIKKNLFIETKNEIFEYIYVIEKISGCKYKKTRVWWIDY